MIQTNHSVKKAVIPAAGFGTRLFPATKAVKKEMFPIIDRNGQAKPVILAIVEEMIDAGIEEIAIVVQEDDRATFEEFFHQTPDYFQKLSAANQKYSQSIQAMGDRITFLTQETQDGFGHCVFCAKDWVNNQPFLLSLGDHVYLSDSEISCSRQLLNIYNIYQAQQKSVVGVTVTPETEIYHCGCVTGHWQEGFGDQTPTNSLLSVTELAEKPTIDYARQHLYIDGMAENSFLTIFGLYVLTPRIFDYLEANIRNNIRERGEFQLTSCLDQLRAAEGMLGYVVQGRSFDIGMPDAYRQTLIQFRES
jgi:UTP--glucose-1-phosphate uridylyltransferase